jgi:hypothetical protein
MERCTGQIGWLIKVPVKSRRIYPNFVVYESMSELMGIAYKESSFSIMNFDWFYILRFETSPTRRLQRRWWIISIRWLFIDVVLTEKFMVCQIGFIGGYEGRIGADVGRSDRGVYLTVFRNPSLQDNTILCNLIPETRYSFSWFSLGPPNKR